MFKIFRKKSSNASFDVNDFDELSNEEDGAPPPPPPSYKDEGFDDEESSYGRSYDESHQSDQDSFFDDDEESLETHELNLNDEPELIDDVISEISYDEVFEGEEARTVYEKKFKKWLSKAEHPKLAFVKKKKKKKDLFTKVQDDVPDQGDVVDKKMDWMYRKQKRLKKRKNRKETPKEMMERIAKRAEIEEAENKKAAEEAEAARRAASLAALGIKLDKDGKPIQDEDDDGSNGLEETNILHLDGWHTRQLDRRLNALYKSICKPELKT